MTYKLSPELDANTWARRKRHDYETLARATGRTITALEADLTAPDPARTEFDYYRAFNEWRRKVARDTGRTLNEVRQEGPSFEQWLEGEGYAPGPKRYGAIVGKARVLSVYATTEAEARRLVDHQLSKPGRYELLRRWRQQGRRVKEIE